MADQQRDQERRERRDGQKKPGLGGARASQLALAELHELTGKELSGVVGLERTREGWKVTVETVEVRRIPTTTDLMATYEVELDREGELTGYQRLHRYVRGAPDEE